VIKYVGHPEDVQCPESADVVALALSRQAFDPAIMKLIYRGKLAGALESNLSPPEGALETYFHYPETPEAIHWLLEFLGDEESRKQLLKANGRTEHRTAVVNYFNNAHPELAKAVVDHFGDDCEFLFSFPNDRDKFLAFANTCADSNDLELLKRGVEATGLNNIAPETRAMFLGSLCGKLFFNNATVDSMMLHYWVDVVSQGPEPDFFTSPFHNPKSCVLLQIAGISNSASLLYEMWVKFRPMIIRQAREKKLFIEQRFQIDEMRSHRFQADSIDDIPVHVKSQPQ
jgi:hypothetical protein